MDMIGKVRRMHRRDNKSVREIARLTGLSRNTVAKWLEAPLEGQPKYRREAQPSKLTAFHEALEQALKADSHRPRRERRTARALYAEVKAGGYEAGYTRVSDFVRAWREGQGQGVLTKAFVPLAKRTHAWNERARRLMAHHDRSNWAPVAWVWLAQARILAIRLAT